MKSYSNLNCSKHDKLQAKTRMIETAKLCLEPNLVISCNKK
ncbi:MAG: hypothetical protein RR891_02870 [Clostridium sp.]